MGMEKEACLLRLPRGAMVRLIEEAGDEAIDGVYIGPEDNSDFVVVPLTDNRYPKKAGDRLLVRFGSRDAMVEFRSEIAEIIAYPVPLWRIGVPAEVNRYDLRDHKRIRCYVSASIESIAKGQVFTGIIRDISKSGARCVLRLAGGAHDPFETDDEITLRCTFPGIPGEQAAAGRVT